MITAWAYPGLDEIIRLVIAEEEARAWDLSSFPHLLLPDLVETHLAQLGLPSAETRHETTLTPLSRAEFRTGRSLLKAARRFFLKPKE